MKQGSSSSDKPHKSEDIYRRYRYFHPNPIITMIFFSTKLRKSQLSEMLPRETNPPAAKHQCCLQPQRRRLVQVYGEAASDDPEIFRRPVALRHRRDGGGNYRPAISLRAHILQHPGVEEFVDHEAAGRRDPPVIGRQVEIQRQPRRRRREVGLGLGAAEGPGGAVVG